MGPLPGHGGHAVAGHTQSFEAEYAPGPHAKKDLRIIKLDKDGNAQWDRLHGGPDGSGGAFSIRQCRDGGLIVCGFTSTYGAGGYDCWIPKLDNRWDLTWSRRAGGAKFDQAFPVIESSGGRFIVAGETLSFGAGNSDGYVLCYDPEGNLLRSRTYGGSSFERLRSAAETPEGTFIPAGHTRSSGAGDKDFLLIEIDQGGSTSSAGSGEIDCWVIRPEKTPR